MADSIERIAADCAWESHRLRNSGAELADYEAWERIATRLRALSPAGGEEWAEKARKMIVELRDYVVNERDSQVLPRKRAGYQRELDEVDALLAASPQQEAATATSGECRCHEGNGALHCTIHTQADFDAQQPTTANESKTNGQTLAGAGGVDAISLAYELEGVIVDVEQGNGFDDICLNTIKRVRDALFAATSAGTTGDDSEDATGGDLIHRVDTALSGDGDLDLDAVVALLRECQDVVKHLRRDDWTITDLSVGDAYTATSAVDKVIRDGKVAVLVSPGYGSGWSTLAQNGDQREWFLFSPEVVAWVEAGKPGGVGALEKLAKAKFGDEYMYLDGGADLEIEWLKQGTLFEIREYHGSETLREIGGVTWDVA